MGPSGNLTYQAVLLVGGVTKQFMPLVCKDVPKALLPVGNRPLLEYTLEFLEANHITKLIVVVAGEAAAVKIESWIEAAFGGRAFDIQLETVAEDAGTADALRAVLHLITVQDFLVVSGDLLCDVSLGLVAAAHKRHGAALSCLLHTRRPVGGADALAGPSAKDKGKQPILDIIGLDSKGQRLLFCASRQDVDKDIYIARSLLQATGRVTMRTDLVDGHLYLMNRKVVKDILDAHPSITSVKRHLVPHIVRMQLIGVTSASDDGNGNVNSISGVTQPVTSSERSSVNPEILPRLMSRAPRQDPGPETSGYICCAVIAPIDQYCARVSTLQAYIDVNREVAGQAIHLTGYTISPNNNVVHQSAVLGNKATVGPQCVVGEGSVLGDKCSVKKSVVGRHCRIGNKCQIINSVVMDHVIMDDGCYLNNTVICDNGHLLEQASLKDCFVEAGYVVAREREYKGESLTKSQMR